MDKQDELAEVVERHVESVIERLSPEQRAMLAGWPKCDGLLYRGESKPNAVAQSLIDAGLARLSPWKHGTQLALPMLGLKVHSALARSALSAAIGEDIGGGRG